MSEAITAAQAAPAAAPSAMDTGSQEAPEGSAIESLEGGQETPETKEEAKYLKNLKLKVFGDEVDESLPDYLQIQDNPQAVEYLTKQFQLSKAAQRAMQENSTFKSQVQQFIGDLKGNTKKALIDMGVDLKTLAAEVIEEEIKKSQLSPQELKQQELEQELERLRNENKQKEEEFNKKELERIQQMEFQKIETEMVDAIKSTDLPINPANIRRVAELMYVCAKNGVDATAAEIAPIVSKEMFDNLKNLINSLPEDKVEDFLGKEVLNRFRKKNLAKAKQTPASLKSGIKDVAQKAEVKQESQKVKMTDFFGKF